MLTIKNSLTYPFMMPSFLTGEANSGPHEPKSTFKSLKWQGVALYLCPSLILSFFTLYYLKMYFILKEPLIIWIEVFSGTILSQKNNIILEGPKSELQLYFGGHDFYTKSNSVCRYYWTYILSALCKFNQATKYSGILQT